MMLTQKYDSGVSPRRGIIPKKLYIVILGVLPLFLMLFFSSSFSAKELKTVNIIGAYVDTVSPNEWYSKNMSFDAPDGISSIFSVKMTLSGYFAQGNTDIQIKLNDQTCTPNYYTPPFPEKRTVSFSSRINQVKLPS